MLCLVYFLSPVVPIHHFSFNETVSIPTIYSVSLWCFQKAIMPAAKFRLNFRKLWPIQCFSFAWFKRQATSEDPESRSLIMTGVATGQHKLGWQLSSMVAMNNKSHFPVKKEASLTKWWKMSVSLQSTSWNRKKEHQTNKSKRGEDGIREYSLYPERKWGKWTSTSAFKKMEQLHGYSKTQGRVVKDVELSWAPEKADWIAKQIYDQDY